MAGEDLNVKKMKVPELKNALKERGLATDGLKGDLINRLELYLEEQEFALPGVTDAPPPAAPKPDAAEETAPPAPAEEPVAATAPAPVVAEEETKKEEASPAKEPETKDAELEKEQPVAGTEPAPAPVVPPEPTPAAAKPMSEMSFEEKKAARAARFGIAKVEKTSPTKKRPQQDNKKDNKNKKQKKQQQKSPQKKKDAPQQKEKPLLPVEEIEKRLKRAEKFGTGDSAQTAELKAMLRKHRFAASS